MKKRITEFRKRDKEAFSMTPLAIMTLVLMVVFGTLAGWLAGRSIAKGDAAALASEGKEAGLDGSGEWQDFVVDCEEGFYHIVLNTSSALPDGFISLSLNGKPLASTLVPDSGNSEVLQQVVIRNVEFPACSNGTLRAGFHGDGMTVESVEMKTGFDSWVDQFSDLPDDPALDSDSDGLSNLEEYMVGGDPLDADDTGYRPVLRDEDQVVYALTDDPRIRYEALASVSSNSVDFSATNAVYVGSKPFGETMLVHFSVLSEPCELVTLDLDYIWEASQVD